STMPQAAAPARREATGRQFIGDLRKFDWRDGSSPAPPGHVDCPPGGLQRQGAAMDRLDAIKKELLAQEKRYWRAIKDKDADTAASLSDECCIVVGAQGVGELDRSKLAGMLEQATYDLKSFS